MDKPIDYTNFAEIQSMKSDIVYKQILSLQTFKRLSSAHFPSFIFQYCVSCIWRRIMFNTEVMNFMFKSVKYHRSFLLFRFCMFNPFLGNVPILYHFKTQDHSFHSVFSVYKMRTLTKNRLKQVLQL